PPTPRAPTAPYSGAILPYTKDETGDVKFDPNAGLLGQLKRPFDWTYGVRTGAIPADVRNPEYIHGAADAAMTYGPTAVAGRAGVPRLFGGRVDDSAGTVRAPTTGVLEDAAEAGFKNYRSSLQ